MLRLMSFSQNIGKILPEILQFILNNFECVCEPSCQLHIMSKIHPVNILLNIATMMYICQKNVLSLDDMCIIFFRFAKVSSVFVLLFFKCIILK